MTKKKILIFGHGYTSNFLSKLLIQEGWTIFSTTREKENFGKISKNSANPILFSDKEAIRKILDTELYILNSIPPSGGEDPVIEEYSSIIHEKKELIKWIGYFSTTSVYGNRNGDWVNEETDPRPELPRSKTRLKIEKYWKNIGEDTNIPVNIFRISGIYGPGRSLLDRLKSGEDIVVVDKPNQLFNRVHVFDIANITYLAMQKKMSNEIFNLSDDHPASQVEVANLATKLLKFPPVKKVSLESNLISDMARSFYLEEKKVSNKKIKIKLGYKLKFPSFSDGLKDILIKSKEA